MLVKSNRFAPMQTKVHHAPSLIGRLVVGFYQE
jgi:hypothetical protein